MLLKKSNIAKYIRRSIPSCDKARDLLNAIEQQFVSFDKAKTNILITSLVSTKYIDKTGMHKYIIEMRDIVVQLNDIKIFILDAFLVHFILTFLL